MAYKIDPDKCVGCGLCVDNCYFQAVEECRKDGEMSGLFGTFYYQISPEKCVQCGRCAFQCPLGCIAWTGEDPAPVPVREVVIDEGKCKGCSLCSRACPVSAISGKVREPFRIDQSKCVRCGYCAKKCKFNAIEVA